MEQEAVLSNLLKSNFSSDISQSNLTFIGQLPNQEQVYFQAHAIAEDNDCGFHTLGLDRSKAVTQLLAHAKDKNIRHLLAPEIQAAFLEGTLPKVMQDNEYQSLWQAYNVAWENYRQTIVAVKEEIRRSNEDYFSAIQSLTPDVLITWLDVHADYAVLKEQLINARLNSLFPIERKLDIYCEKEETFKAFVTHYLSKGGWLTYIGNYQNKTQQTSSLDALAELNQLRILIWQADAAKSSQLQLVHEYGQVTHPVIHMLHTHGMTHYDLLQRVEKSIFELISLQKKDEEGKLDAIILSLFSSNSLSSFEANNELKDLSDSNNTQLNMELGYEALLQQADEAKQWGEKHKEQLLIAEKQYAKALQKVVLSNRYDQQADCLKSLGDMYLNKKEYTQACALYNAARIRCEKADYLDKDKGFYQEVLIHRIKYTEKLLLEEALHRSVKANEISAWTIDEQHKKILEALRQWCKQTLAEIDQAYPLDQIYEYGEGENKEKEVKLHELQLARAVRIRSLYQYIAEAMKKLIRQMLEECQTVLGNPPCDYAIMGLGSLAREEMTPYSDFEFAILITEEKESYKQYFRNLTKLLHLKVINLGETILPAMAIPALNDYYSNNPLDNWFYDDVTPRGFAFDGAMPQACKTPLGKKDKVGNTIYELIHTPEEMVKFLGKKSNDLEGRYWFDHEPHLSMILITGTLIEGSENLLKIYINNAWKVLKQTHTQLQLSLHRTWALQLLKGEKLFEKGAELKGDIYEFQIDPNSEEEEGKLYDVKKEIYRFPDRIIERLAIYFGIVKNTVWERIEDMSINKVAKDHLKITTSITTELRLQVYLASNGQHEMMTVYNFISDLKNDIIDKACVLFHIPHLSQLFRFYFTALPLYKSVMEFCLLPISHFRDVKKEDNYLAESTFFDRGLKNQGLIYKRLLQYSRAQNCLQQWIVEHPDDDLALNSLGTLYDKLGQVELAAKYYKNALEIQNVQFEKQFSPNVVALLNNLGRSCCEMAQYEMAIKHFQTALLMQQEYYGNEPNLRIAILLNNLGESYRGLGKYELAIKYYQAALEMQKKLQSNRLHVDIVMPLNNLGIIYHLLGKYEIAIKYHQEALNIKKQLYGSQPHPSVSHSLNNLGIIYTDLNQFETAAQYYQIALAIYKKIYGERDHPATAEALANLGSVYCELGHYNVAMQHTQEALTMKRRICKDSFDLSFANSLNNLGNIHGKLGQYETAIECHKEVLRIRKQIYSGRIHLEIAASLTNLGDAYRSLGKYLEAISYCQEALSIQKQIYQGQPHKDIAGSLNNLGSIYTNLGQYNVAIQTHQEALLIRREVYKNCPHSEIADSLNNLGNAYEALGQYEPAIKHHEEALAIRKQVYQNRAHADVAISLNNLGSAYHALKQYEVAIKYHQEALILRKQIYLQKRHPDIAASLNNLGAAYAALKQHEKALRYFDDALAMQKVLYKNQLHADITASLNNLGIVCYALKRHQEAIQYFQEALTMRKQLYQNRPHPDILASLCNLGNVYISTGQLEQGIELLEQSHILSRSLLGDNHPTTKTVETNLFRAEKYLQDCQQKLNEVKQAVSPKTEINLIKEDDEELSEAIALSLNIPQKEAVSTNYSSATLLAQHSGVYGNRHQASQETSQSTAALEGQALSSRAEEKDLELEEALRLSLGKN